MDFNIEVRKKQLKSLKQYISSSEDSVNAVLQSLGWTSKKTLESNDINVTCPINKNHVILSKSAEEHIKKCKLNFCGYQTDNNFLSDPPENENGTCIKLDNKTKIDVLNHARISNSGFRAIWNGHESDAMTSDRLLSTFSSDERLALYDYSVKNTAGPSKPPEFTLEIPDSKNGKGLSEKEKLALERDAKRRRVKYKSVHTSKKSHTEVTREVIDNQMELYTQWIKQKEKQERREKERQKEKEKLAEEEACRREDQSQYHYIETTYQNQPQNNFTNLGQTGQSGQFPETYGTQYYGNITNSEGVITDWSHVYQGVVDTDFNIEPSQYMTEYAGAPVVLEPTQNYTNSQSMSHMYNGYNNGINYSQSVDLKSSTNGKLNEYTYTTSDSNSKEKNIRYEPYHNNKSVKDKQETNRRYEREGNRDYSSERKYQR